MHTHITICTHHVYYFSGTRTPSLPRKPIKKPLATKANLSKAAARSRQMKHEEKHKQKIATWAEQCAVTTQV